jgi:hypothetical protein
MGTQTIWRERHCNDPSSAHLPKEKHVSSRRDLKGWIVRISLIVQVSWDMGG